MASRNQSIKDKRAIYFLLTLIVSPVHLVQLSNGDGRIGNNRKNIETFVSAVFGKRKVEQTHKKRS